VRKPVLIPVRNYQLSPTATLATIPGDDEVGTVDVYCW
jgi:hypothetical protein